MQARYSCLRALADCEVLLQDRAVNSHVMCIMPHVSLAWAQGAPDMRSALNPLYGLLIVLISRTRLTTTYIASTILMSLHAAESPSLLATPSSVARHPFTV